ncbi:uncharacterized protein FOMMEDRAFT_62349, partial [Fomitiporia mediterranea MF3/22]|uniref:uncharacterized protein n=1 Tax=Fomitiporia mediterranea (strain MF3/22) TaxID=694068 RepID=UPI0004409411
DELLQAAELRAQQDPPPMNIKQLAHIHDLKQQFRRLIDPGIMRPNNKETALMALKTLETLSDNLLREHDNEKFRSFKPTNNAIKKRLVDVKGALEYAVAQFQPIYIFNDRHLEELQIGNEILKETLIREAEKQEKASQVKLTEKELREIARRKVQLNFHEDRLEKQLKDKREADSRAAREAAGAAPASPTSPTTS